MKKVLVTVLAMAMAVSAFSACGKPDNPADSSSGGSGDNVAVIKQGTYHTHTAVMPSNWSELTYADNNDTQILNNLVSPFFEYDFKFDEAKGGKYKADGTVNADAIVSGGFDVKYSAATAIADVTSKVDAKWGYTDDQKAKGGYAWKITLRNDLKWDDGTPIDAGDFVYTMKEQLNPLFLNMRANTYYNQNPIRNASKYLYSLDDFVNVSLKSQGYKSIEEAQAATVVYLDFITLASDLTGGGWKYDGAYKVKSYNAEAFDLVVDYDSVMPKWLDIATEDKYLDPAIFKAAKGKYAKEDGTLDVAQIKADKFDASKFIVDHKAVLAMDLGGATVLDILQPGNDNDEYTSVQIANENKDYPFDKVGIYADGDYDLVVCFDKQFKFFKEDGVTLSYLAAYNMASLPLVKEDLYEKCKVAPVEGATLWTSTYNTSKETSASWGPYKLTEFQSGKAYTLSRNDNWYGYALEDNKNQYNVTKIECEKIEKVETQWMGFLNGTLDDVGLDPAHKDDYRNSKYTKYAPATGTFGINLQANLNALKTAGRNNGILAIKDFRKAISLGLNRDDYNGTCYTSHKSCFGLMGPSYYYDVENGGVYRDTPQAKKALLRVYGFTENDDGSWTSGGKNFKDYEKAYRAMTGYDPAQAKDLVKSAYDELVANKDKYGYDPAKMITLKYGTSSDNANTQRNFNYVKKSIDDLVKGTPLEGKVEVVFDASFGAKWSDAFKNCEYDIAAGTGFSGGPFDPFGFMQVYVDPDAGLMYSTWWDTKSDMMTFKMPEGDYEGAGKEYTMSVFNWYSCLNGLAEINAQDNKFNWGEGSAPGEARMELLAKLEEYTLNQYYTIATTSQFGASLLGAKFSYLTDEHNIFMAFGGMRYMTVNYTDAEWADYVKANNNNLEAEYKKAE